MQNSRPAQVFVYGGIALYLTAVSAAVAIGLAGDSPLTPLQRAADRALVAPLGILPPALAGLAWHRRDRAILGLAAVLSVPGALVTLGASLVAGLGWLLALGRVPHRASTARPAPPGVALAAAAVLIAAAALVPLIHHDPGCWTFTEDADGTRTYEPAPELADAEPGFAWRGPATMGSRSEAADQAIDSQTGQPVDGQRTGQVCHSDRTNVAQAGAVLLLTGGAAFAASRLAARPVRRPRAPRDDAARA